MLKTGNGGGVKHASFGQRRLVLAAACADGDVAEGPTGGPVAVAALTEVSRLINIVVVEVTEFGLHAFASGAGDYFLRRPLFFIIVVIVAVDSFVVVL